AIKPWGSPPRPRNGAGGLARWSLGTSAARSAASLLPPTLLHDAALRLPARLLLAAHELPITLAEVVAAEEVRLDLENRRAAAPRRGTSAFGRKLPRSSLLQPAAVPRLTR